MHPRNVSSTPPATPVWKPFVAWQPIVLGCVIASVLGVLFYTQITSAMVEQRDSTLADVDRLRAANLDYQRIAGAKDFAEQKARLQEEFEAFVAQVTPEAEREKVLDDCGRLADGTGVTLTVYKPGQGKPLQVPAGALPALSEQPIHVEVRGTYAGLRKLFEAYTRFDRLITVTGYKLKVRPTQQGGATLDAEMDIKTYYKKVAAAPGPARAQAPAPAR